MSRPKNSIMVELWGLPGVGKTTLAERLVADANFTFIASRPFPLRRLRLTACYPRTVFIWSQLIFKNFLVTKSVSILRYNFSLLFSALQRYYDAERSPNERLVIDEGLLQRFLSYSDVVFTPKLIKRLLSTLPPTTYLVQVNDREVVSDRYETNHLRAKLGPTYLAGWKETMQANIEILADVLRAHAPEQYFETAQTDIMQVLTSSKL